MRNTVNLASSGGEHFRRAQAKYGEEARLVEMVNGKVFLAISSMSSVQPEFCVCVKGV